MSEYYGRVNGTDHAIFALHASDDKVAIGIQRYGKKHEAKVIRSVTVCDRDDSLTLCFACEDGTSVIVETGSQNYGVLMMKLVKKNVKVDFI